MSKMFSGDLAFLSNFSQHPAVFEWVQYPTVEHAFQAAKTFDKNERAKVLRCGTPGTAKRLGRQLYLRPDWEQSKLPIMRLLLASKFSLDTGLAIKLLETGSLRLVETNTWHDNIWGDCLCGAAKCSQPGQNLLGESLMFLRSYISGALV